MRPTQPIIIVQGGQWGSEAKGAIAAFLCLTRDVKYAVRTGAVNAGHTVYYMGREYKMQQLPVGFVNPRAYQVLGAGAMINPYILAREIKELNESLGEDIRHRLLIDDRCGLHLNTHQTSAQAANRHHKMGATGKGCSEAVTAKIRERGNLNPLQFKRWLQEWGNVEQEVGRDLATYLTGLQFCDTEAILNSAYDNGDLILLEATQGTLLDLHLGPYPYTTHKQTIANQWATECGLSLNLAYEVVSVCRTYPIRVAGNSGPMPLELSWIKLARRINEKLVRRGLKPMVAESAIEEFETACYDIAKSKYVPQGLCPTNIHDYPDIDFPSWNIEKREAFRVVLSELHKDALNAIGAESLKELKKFFEMTTVTRKLRRISEWEPYTMSQSMRWNRPDYICLTFLNYEFPQYWGETKVEVIMADPSVREYIGYIENSCGGVEVRYVTTGPNSEHVLNIRYHKLVNARKAKGASA